MVEKEEERRVYQKMDSRWKTPVTSRKIKR